MRVQLLLLTVIGVTTSCLTGCWVDNQMRYDWAGVKSFWTSDPDPQPSYAQNEPQPPAYQQGGEQGKQPQYNVASNPNGSRYSGAYNPNRNMDGLQGAPAAGPIGSQHQPQPGSYNGAGSQPIAPQQSYALPAKTGEHNSSLFNEGQARPAAAQPQPGSAPPLAAPSGAGAGNYLTPPAGQGPAVGYTPPANPQAEATPPGINGGMSQGMQGNASPYAQPSGYPPAQPTAPAAQPQLPPNTQPQLPAGGIPSPTMPPPPAAASPYTPQPKAAAPYTPLGTGGQVY